ncbi:MAG: hypothetical protein UX18_C0021G0016, partial [Candidatus Azambacteria bacterium GW2011_GWC2_45_7b]
TKNIKNEETNDNGLGKDQFPDKNDDGLVDSYN